LEGCGEKNYSQQKKKHVRGGRGEGKGQLGEQKGPGSLPGVKLASREKRKNGLISKQTEKRLSQTWQNRSEFV